MIISKIEQVSEFNDWMWVQFIGYQKALLQLLVYECILCVKKINAFYWILLTKRETIKEREFFQRTIIIILSW